MNLLRVFLLAFFIPGALISQTTTVFNYTGGSQSWTVPSCVNSVTFTVAGAQGGGNAYGDPGGNGAIVTYTMPVNPGDVFNFVVGSAGQCPGAGFGGGGSGQFSNIAAYNSCGGGGASAVSLGGSPLIIAAGGGGSGGGDSAGPGGNGGCATGSSVFGGFGSPGGGGTQSAGGSGGAPYAAGGGWGTNGSAGQGGNGGDDTNASQSPGGGGGGGYYGGGGGGSDYIGFSTAVGGSGGGGGSSLVPGGAGCVGGTNVGNGYISITYTGGLTALAANTGPYCEEETIQLNGSGGSIFNWTGPNGFTSNLQNPTIPASVPNMSGVYQLIVTDAACPDADTTTTTVTVNPKPDADPVADQILCHGAMTQQVDFTGTVPGTSYSWTNNNTNTGLGAAGIGTIPAFSATAIGVTQVSTVTVTPSTALCVGDDISFTITAIPSPVLNVSNDTIICENGTANLTATGSGGGGGPYTYHWDFTPSTAGNQMVNPSVATTYSVTVENPLGCISAPQEIDVTLHPPLAGAITPWDTICPGFFTDITAGAMGGIGVPYTFNWSTNQTFTGIPSHTINVGPAFTSNYIVTITDGCESSPLVLTTNVHVAPLPVPAVQVLNPIQCEPANFDLVNITDPAMSEFSYWLVNGTDHYLNQDMITTNDLWAGDYDVQLIITSYEGCVDSLTFTDLLHVVPRPTADFRYAPNPVLMFDPKVHFTNYSILGYTYEWIFDGGIPATSTQTNVDVQFPDGYEGRYDVTLITTSELGCTDTMIHELIVYPEMLIYAPNSFTPDGDEHNQVWNIYMEGIDVYDFELLIFNRWGEVIWESHDINVGWDGSFAGRTVETGSYTWVVHTKDLMNDAKYTFSGHINLLR